MTERDLNDLRSLAIKAYTELPLDARFRGAERSLNEDERRSLSWLLASAMILVRNGLVPPFDPRTDLAGLMERNFDSVNEE